MTTWDRRTLLRTMGAAAAAAFILDFQPGQAMAAPDTTEATLGAFADAVWPGTTAAAVLEVLRLPVLGIAGQLPALAAALNQQAALNRQGALNRPGALNRRAAGDFAALPRSSRAAIVEQLTAPARPDHQTWVGLAVLSAIAAQTGQYQQMGQPA
jgi:hypothetical protein